MHAAGVNPVDAYIRSGTYARKPALPYTPGTDGAGEVEAVGADVKGVKPGDRVYVAGDNIATERRRHVCGAGDLRRRRCCIRCRRIVTFGQGAAIGVPYATALPRRSSPARSARAGETVLVHGATGGVGIAAVELAHAHGMQVIGTGGTERGLKSCASTAPITCSTTTTRTTSTPS